jgi:hypothetical protein
MVILLSRQITDAEKSQIIAQHGRKCYATGHTIPESEPIHFDHIRAFADGGHSEIDNIAPMCQEHNLAKGSLPLGDFRVKLRLDDFFKQGQSLTLKHELKYFKDNGIIADFGKPVYVAIKENNIELEFLDQKKTYYLSTCPVTGWQYFYATLPVGVLNSDDDEDGKIGLQPRYLISNKVFDLYRHLQRNTILHPSIARLHQNKILVFDGQHKIAALLWGERKEFELKIYINPDPQRLNQTNILAHDKFAQTRFYSSILVTKLGGQFNVQFDEYKQQETDKTKSESGFVRFLVSRSDGQLSKANIQKQFVSFLYNSILDKTTNKLARLVSDSNRGSKGYPLTIDMLHKSLFADFVYRHPTDDDLTGTNYRRDDEIKNVIKFCNILYEETSLDQWDDSKSENDITQNKLNRIFRSKSIMVWSGILRDAIVAKLEVLDSEDQELLFYRHISDVSFDGLRKVLRRFAAWKLWDAPVGSEIDGVLATNKNEIKRFFKEHGLTAGYLLGAPE